MGIVFAGQKPVPAKLTTPARFEIKVEPSKKGRKAIVSINPQQVQPASHMSAEWHYWVPPLDTQLPKPKIYWTKLYIGTDEKFYKQGYRWGISIGGTPEEFKRSALYLPEGGINLPNGKYMIAIRQNQAGKKEVVIGKEDRGTDKRTLDAFAKGIKPVTNQFNEVLGVSNHSMLISRGKPYVPGVSDPDDYSAAFAGEIEIINHRINTMNDQTGQIFGPNGLIAPPDKADLVKDMAMKQPDYEDGKSAALKAAHDTLMEITGNPDIRMVKVKFFNDGLSAAALQQPQALKIKAAKAASLETILKEPSMQALFDQFINEPEKQARLLKAFAQHGEFRYAAMDLQKKLVDRGTLKPEQGAALALELLDSPDAMSLFLPESPYFIAGLSDNTKRKLLSAYNAMPKEDRPEFRKLLLTLKQHRNLVKALAGQRVPGSMFRAVLQELDTSDKTSGLVQSLFNTAMTLPEIEPYDLSGTDAMLIGHISLAGKVISDLEKRAKKHKRKELTVILQNNPFNGGIVSLGKLRPHIERLRQLQEQGITIYASPAFKTNRAYDYLKDLFVFAHSPMTSEDAVDRNDIQGLLTVYGVNTKSLHTFAQERFRKRWGNNQIITAYALKDPAFKAFLEDLNWIVNLPIASI